MPLVPRRARARGLPYSTARRYGRSKGGCGTGNFPVELSFIDTSGASTLTGDFYGADWVVPSYTSPSGAGHLTAVAKGTGASQRIGNRIVVKSLMLHGFISVALTATSGFGSCPIVRVAVVLDQQTNNTTFSNTIARTVFDDSGLTAHKGLAFRDLEQVGRFKVLKDEFFALKPVAATEASGTYDEDWAPETFTWYFKDLEMPQTYSDDNATITSVVDNAIHVIVCNLSSANTTTTVLWKARARFIS